MNKVILIGRLTKTPELRMTQSGIASANFSLAVEKQILLTVLYGENKLKI